MDTPNRTPGSRRRFYDLHRWTGLIAALLGMLVFFSGAVATFHEELDAWASRGDRHGDLQATPGFDLDAAFVAAQARVKPEYRQEVFIFQPPGRQVGLYFHKHEKGEDVGTLVAVAPESGRPVYERHGNFRQAFRPPVAHALGAFFVDLHIYLLMPQTLGLIATGLAGFALTLLIVTGTIVHWPNRSRALQRPRTKKPRQLAGDLHTMAGLWTLPYTAVLATTGTFFSLAGAVLVPVVALVAFNGNMEALFAKVVGEVPVSAGEGVARLQPIVADATSRAEGRVAFVSLEHWGQEKARATVRIEESTATSTHRRNFVYDGHTGEFLTEKPPLGTKPSLGGWLFELMGLLHFGTLFGLTTKVLWSVLGLFTCALSAVGLLVYVERSRKHAGRWQRVVEAMTVALSGGLPLATAATCLAWVVAMSLVASPATDVLGALSWVFLSTLALTFAMGMAVPLRGAVRACWAAAGLAFLLLVAVAPLATGVGLGAVWADPRIAGTLVVDATLLMVGVLLLRGAQVVGRQPFGAPVPSGVGDEGPAPA